MQFPCNLWFWEGSEASDWLCSFSQHGASILPSDIMGHFSPE